MLTTVSRAIQPVSLTSSSWTRYDSGYPQADSRPGSGQIRSHQTCWWWASGTHPCLLCLYSPTHLEMVASLWNDGKMGNISQKLFSIPASPPEVVATLMLSSRTLVMIIEPQLPRLSFSQKLESWMPVPMDAFGWLRSRLGTRLACNRWLA